MAISIRFEPIWRARVNGTDHYYYFSNFAVLRESIVRTWTKDKSIIATQPTTTSVLITEARSGRMLLEAEEIKLTNLPVDLV